MFGFLRTNKDENNINNEKHKLILVTTSVCPHCKDFKNLYLDNLNENIESNFTNVDFYNFEAISNKNINIYQSGKKLDQIKYPTNILATAQRVPHIFMISGKAWTKQNLDKSDFYVYPLINTLKPESITKWVNETQVSRNFRYLINQEKNFNIIPVKEKPKTEEEKFIPIYNNRIINSVEINFDDVENSKNSNKDYYKMKF